MEEISRLTDKGRPNQLKTESFVPNADILDSCSYFEGDILRGALLDPFLDDNFDGTSINGLKQHL